MDFISEFTRVKCPLIFINLNETMWDDARIP
jgi:hypothetical protein